MAAAALLWAAMISTAAAQDVATTPTNIPGIGIVAAPPRGFDPVNASPAERAHFGIPPAPDARIAPHAHEVWKRVVSSPRNHEVPVFEQTNVFHGPVHKIGSATPLTRNSVATTSTNWSGTSVVNGDFSASAQAVSAQFVVPTARQAFGACTGGWVYSAQWPGIDGNGSNDVLQAGTEADAYCNGTTINTNYYAWIEWYPRASVKVSRPAIHPGDLIFVQVWSTSPTTGFAYFYNFSTTESSPVYSLTAPRTASLQANSVEWIVERPTIGGGLGNLTNYIDMPWAEGVAWNYTGTPPTYYFQGADPSAGTLEVLTMLDNAGNPISVPTVESPNFLWFQDAGSACSVSGSVEVICTPF